MLLACSIMYRVSEEVYKLLRIITHVDHICRGTLQCRITLTCQTDRISMVAGPGSRTGENADRL